ncbi:MAG: hypothetical protein N3A38_04535 [Planctomycetota bacterium]|nr:hypothetical protein [Planctomycetota bacterium]
MRAAVSKGLCTAFGLALPIWLCVTSCHVSAGEGPGNDEDVAKKLRELSGGRAKLEAEVLSKNPLPGGSILDTRSLWRFRILRSSPEFVDADGRIIAGRVVYAGELRSWIEKNPDKGTPPPGMYKVEPLEKEKVYLLPADTPPDWMKPDFDDTSWARQRGPVFPSFWSPDDEFKTLLMRGRFEVTDPAKAGDLKLSMEYRGGVVVYLNGEEVYRSHMPEGPVNLETTALPYPETAYVTKEGFVLPWARQTTRSELDRRPQEVKARVASRTRAVRDVILPGSKLRRGANVLAISIHRAPTPAAFELSRPEKSQRIGHHEDFKWRRLGLLSINLKAEPGSAVIPNVGPASASGEGFRLWNQSCMQAPNVRDYPEPLAPLRPLRIHAVRNGTFAGQIMAGDTKPIRGLKVEASELKGPATIPASCVRVRYGVPDGPDGNFDSLEDDPPAEVPVNAESGRAIVPIWIEVTVPHDSPGGEYSGYIAVGAEGVPPLKAPIFLRVREWRLPAVSEFALRMDFMQSPETVAMAYRVPLWSDEHLKLLDRTFSLLAAMASKTLYVTAIRRTHLGNEHAMVRWIMDENGDYRPDFAIVEKYLDAAMKRMGKIPGVILYCWEPPFSQGHAGGAGEMQRIYDKPILFTAYDPDSGEYSARQGPPWGTPEAREFWKKFTDGIQPVIEKRGLRDSMLFGLVGDARPTKRAMDDICNAVPGARWAVHSHYRCEQWQGYRMGMWIALWGLGYSLTDPSVAVSCGWSNPEWCSYYPREMGTHSTLVEYRTKAEAYIGACRQGGPRAGDGPRGLGRLNADFWELKDERGRAIGSLAGRYPESAWGQLNLNPGVPPVLARGRKGPIPTMRSEAFRAAAQDIEMRVFIEKALLDPDGPRRLGPDLARRCRKALDARIRYANRCAQYMEASDGEIWFIGSGWEDRTALLCELVEEIGKKFTDREPRVEIPAAAKDAKGGSK